MEAFHCYLVIFQSAAHCSRDFLICIRICDTFEKRLFIAIMSWNVFAFAGAEDEQEDLDALKERLIAALEDKLAGESCILVFGSNANLCLGMNFNSRYKTSLWCTICSQYIFTVKFLWF